jgi:DNA-binding response OmpR family regulator
MDDLPRHTAAVTDAPHSLLLVADDDDILALVCHRMEKAGYKAGYEVVRAHDGEEALQLASELLPALAILGRR